MKFFLTPSRLLTQSALPLVRGRVPKAGWGKSSPIEKYSGEAMKRKAYNLPSLICRTTSAISAMLVSWVTMMTV